MKFLKTLFLKNTSTATTASQRNANAITDRIRRASAEHPMQLYAWLNTSANGLSSSGVEESREKYGENIVTHGKQDGLLKRLAAAFINPFTIILFILAVVSTITDVILVEPGEKDPTTVIIICAMIILSGVLRFVQETRSGNAAQKLTEMIHTTACVEREETGRREIPIDEIVVGDTVHLSAGDMIPADIRLTYTKDLFISQSALTGESEPVEKFSGVSETKNSIGEYSNIAFMGTNVISGSASGIVIGVGNETLLGSMAGELSEKPQKTAFEKGVSSVSWTLIRFMLIMVPIVFFINGLTKGDWLDAALFAISIAVGLTPEMLPMIVTTCLAKGAVSMSKKKVVIKNLNSIQNLGSIDVLCTDKTGTLTQDKVVLEYNLDINGNEDDRILRHAFLNSYYQTGLKNLIDVAIINRTKELSDSNPDLLGLENNYAKTDEIPFDFQRRRMSVVVEDKNGKVQMITKGAIEEMLEISSYVELNGEVLPLTNELKELVLRNAERLNSDGMRVLGVAQKSEVSPVGALSAADEADMVLMGYLAFLDPPKKSAAAAIKALKSCNVDVKILTGDNEKVSKCICAQVGLDAERVVLGSEIDDMSDSELFSAAETATVFAKLSPAQKSRVVRVLKANGRSVGYMGDGINDAAAIKAADVGISVDTAVDIAKESADAILLEKDLTVLKQGVTEGRKIYINMIKYIKMTASSNFGNMLSVLAASAFLPFLPMTAVQLLLLNMVYDISCISVPWDNVDKEALEKPKAWDASAISKFMVCIGPISSIFDIITYLLMYYAICPAVCGGAYHQLDTGGQLLFIAIFQTGWFIESIWSQTLIIHMLRTPKIPFVQSHASLQVIILTTLGIAALTIIPFTPLGPALGLTSMPAVYSAYLAAIIAGYMALATIVKKLYIRKYGDLL